jgi:phospholipid/cholesterol/gamma-HCH transport system ATP-binding protein
MAAPVVDVVELRKAFERVEVLRGVSFRLDKGETLVVMGGSGSGKTVLLRHVAGLVRPDAGEVRTFGINIERLSEEELLPIRQRMGYVFQGAALFDSLSVYENVAFPLREHTELPESEIRTRIVHVLSLVGLGEDILRLVPSELSGGMRKRVGVARALVIEPELMLFDEPTAGLDPTNAKMVGELIVQLKDGVGDTSIVVTHDVELARTVADRLAILMDGRFAVVGRPDEVMTSGEPAVQAFLAGEAR